MKKLKSMTSVLVVLASLLVMSSCFFAAGMNVWLSLFIGLAMMWILVLALFNLCPRVVYCCVCRVPMMLGFAKWMRRTISRRLNASLSPFERYFVYSAALMVIVVSVIYAILSNSWTDFACGWLVVVYVGAGICLGALRKFVYWVKAGVIDDDTAYCCLLFIFMFGITIAAAIMAATQMFNIAGGFDLVCLIVGGTTILCLALGIIGVPVWLGITYIRGK